MIAEGEIFPSFKKAAWSGEEINLDDLRGMIVVMYFYPHDGSSESAKAAAEFTKLYDQFTDYNAEVIGVSVDSAQSHADFCAKHNIAIPLLTDEKGMLAKRLGIADGKGRAKRTTVVIDRDGTVAKIYADINSAGHAHEVLEFVRSL